MRASMVTIVSDEATVGNRLLSLALGGTIEGPK
jgi:hypothetical protein